MEDRRPTCLHADSFKHGNGSEETTNRCVGRVIVCSQEELFNRSGDHKQNSHVERDGFVCIISVASNMSGTQFSFGWPVLMQQRRFVMEKPPSIHKSTTNGRAWLFVQRY
jgi:hypothetical protein